MTAEQPASRTILLGAGASVEAGIDDAKRLAQKIHAALKTPAGKPAADLAVAGTLFHKSFVEQDPFGGIDVEELYQTFRLLGERTSNPLSAFVGAWKPEIALAERPHTNHFVYRVLDDLAAGLKNIGNGTDPVHPLASASAADFSQLASTLKKRLSEGLSPEHSIFFECARDVRTEVVNRCWIFEKRKATHLKDLVQSSVRVPLWIASLNYDRAIELCGEFCGIPVDIGIDNPSGTVDFKVASKIRLAKLHGSVDWCYAPEGTFRLLDSPDPEKATMIFGAGNKLQVMGPFLDLLIAFRTQLRTTDSVDVCGYSFRDPHVNHLLVDWLRADTKHRLHVFDPEMRDFNVLENLRTRVPFGWSYDVHKHGAQIRVEKATAGEWAAGFKV